MWKDFFYYSRSQRRAVLALLVLFALWLLGIVMLPDAGIPLTDKTPYADSTTLKTFEQKMKTERFPRKKSFDSTEIKTPAVLKTFNPNRADSMELSSLGLPSYVVRNILKYRQKGGRFRTPESLARVYGLTEEKFNELKPYVRITPVEKEKSEKLDTAVRPVWKEKKVFKYPVGTLIDVNSADTTELKKIPGIGSGIAGNIVRYRNRLGGFYNLSQLEEVKHVTPELLKWFKLGNDSVRKMEINKMSLDKLRAHPYLNFYQARIIVEHRRKKGQIKSLSQLALYEEFTEKDLERLSAYVSLN